MNRAKPSLIANAPMTATAQTRASKSAPCATITIDSGFAVVTRGFEQLLRPVLSYELRQYRRSHDNRLEHRRVQRPAYELRNDGTLVVAEGCVERVAKRLRQAGIHVEIEDLQPISDQDSGGDVVQVQGFDPSLLAFLNSVRAQRLGILEVPRGRRRARIAADLCKIFKGLRVFIACSTTKVAKMLADELSSLLGTDVDAVHLRNWQFHTGCRIVCGTYASFDSSSPEDWDIVLIEDAEEAIRSRVWNNLTSFAVNMKRRYALASSRSQWPASTNLECDVLFGSTIYHARRAVRDRDQVNVVFVAAPLNRDCEYGRRGVANRRTAQRSAADRAEGSRQQRRQLWHSELRNNLIADIARGFARRQSEPIWRAGLFLDHPAPFNGLPENPRVAVLVETVEHAALIRRALPDWMICDAQPRDSVLTQPQLSADMCLLPDRAIVTVANAERYLRLDPDVLVVAIGGTATYLPRGLSRRRNSVLVVDLVDDDGSLESASQRRRRGYVSIGCHVQDREPGQAQQRRDRRHGTATVARNI